MARAYSEDLRRRVITAIAGGLVFARGGTTLRDWGIDSGRLASAMAGQRGLPGAPTGPSEGLKARRPCGVYAWSGRKPSRDISLTEIAARLRTERGVSACTATVGHFFGSSAR
jgi:hypothetical protein